MLAQKLGPVFCCCHWHLRWHLRRCGLHHVLGAHAQAAGHAPAPPRQHRVEHLGAARGGERGNHVRDHGVGTVGGLECIWRQ